MKTLKKRMLSLLLMALMLTFAACGQDKVDYDKLKTDIVGIWCGIDGPEYLEDNDGVPYYQLYEFTSDGMLAYHIITPAIASYYDFNYTLRDDFLDVDGNMCRVSIDANDVLTMSNDKGDTQYRRMSMEEVCNFGVVYLDEHNYLAQVEYTEAFSKNWPLASSSETAEENTDDQTVSSAADTETEEASESMAS